MQNLGSPRTIATYLIILFAFLVAAIISVLVMTPNINYSNATNVSGLYKINYDSIPTIINGITAVTSIIIGFTGAIIGIFYQAFKEDETSKSLLYISAFYAVAPLSILFVVYYTLLLGFIEVPLKLALIALGLSLINIITVILGSFYRLSQKSKTQVPSTVQLANPPPSTTQQPTTQESQKNDANKTVNITINME